MNAAEADAIMTAVAAWAFGRDDIRALALAGSWARGAAHEGSDIDMVLLSEEAHDYRGRRDWLTAIDFRAAGFAVQSTEDVTYGAVWSRHVHLLPRAKLELTFAELSWAKIDPIDSGTQVVVSDAFRIMFDKDGLLARLMGSL